MRRPAVIVISSLMVFYFISAYIAEAQETAFDKNPFFRRNDPSKCWENKNPHGGAGYGRGMELTPREEFKSNFLFLHRGVWNPKCGIGEHAHRSMEEMYVVLTSYAQFTVNGRTAEIPSIGMAVCPMGSSHGIYNASDEPIQFLNWGVAYSNQQYDAVNFNNRDDLVNAEIESPPSFMWAILNRDMLHPVENFYGGKGTVRTRAVWTSENFRTNWEYMHHYLIPPGSSIGLHRHDKMEVVYYILSGKGRGTINNATYDIMAGDAMSCTLHNSIGVYNNSKEDLEIIAVGVAMEKGKVDGVPVGDDLVGR